MLNSLDCHGRYATLAGFIPAAEVAASLPGHSSGQIETR